MHITVVLVVCISEVLKELMMFVTGSYQASLYTVMFVDIDSSGNDGNVALSAHTIPKELHLPRAIFEDSEEAYCCMYPALMAAMDPTHNTI